VLQFRLFTLTHTHTHHRDGATSSEGFLLVICVAVQAVLSLTHRRDGWTSSEGFLLVIYAAVQTVLSHTRLRVGSTSSEGFWLVICAAVQTVLSHTHTHRRVGSTSTEGFLLVIGAAVQTVHSGLRAVRRTQQRTVDVRQRTDYRSESSRIGRLSNGPTRTLAAFAKYCDQHVRRSVCLSARLSQRPRVQILSNFLRMLSVAFPSVL